MNTKQLNKLTMYLAVEGICDAHPSIWQGLTAFGDTYAEFVACINNIQTLSQSQSQDIKGVALDKKASRKAMCESAHPIAMSVHAFAVKAGNHTLAGTVDFSLSDLMVGRDVQSRDHCQIIANTATANLASLGSYGVTDAKINVLTSAIASYSLLISKPRDARVQVKTITSNLQAEMDTADVKLGILDDLLGQINDAVFASDYRNARIIVDIPASHNPATPPPAPPAPPNG